MHKIDGLDATPAGRFQDPNPAAGILGTVITAKWANAVQEELVGVIERAAITPSDANNAQFLQALQALYGSGVSGGALKNALINGSFDLWQRGLSFACTNASRYTADRWDIRSDAAGVGTGTATVSRQDFAPGQTEVPGATRFLRYVQNTNATNGQPAIIQRIENLERFSGGKVSISFYAKASATLSCSARITQDFGAGGSAAVNVAVQAFTASTVWTRYKYSFTLPSMSGATLGTNPNLRITFNLATGSTFTVELADVQVELASDASAFDRRPLPLELILARRYFSKSYPLDVPPGTDGGSAGLARRGAARCQRQGLEEGGNTDGIAHWYELAARLPVPMRATPTVSWYKPATAGTIAVVEVVVPSGPSFSLVDFPVTSTANGADSSTGYPITGSALDAQSNIPAYAHWTADAEI